MGHHLKNELDHLKPHLSELVHHYPYYLVNEGLSTLGFAGRGSTFSHKLLPAKV